MKLTLFKLIFILSAWLFCINAFAQYKPGQLDLTFKAPAITGTVLKTAQVPDVNVVTRSVEDNGSMFIVGNFSQVGSKSFGGVAKLNADGSLDTTFGSDPTFKGAIGANDTIYDCAFFSNGNQDTTYLILVGKFASFNGDKFAKNIAIVDQNGKIAVDMSKYIFDNTIYGIESNGNGQYYLYGKFGKPKINGVVSNMSYMLKLNAGTTVFPALPMDATFQSPSPAFTINGPVYTVAADRYSSYVYVGGRFSIPHRYIFRFQDSGNGYLSQDYYFMNYSGMSPDSIVRRIGLHYPLDPQAPTEIMISGDFTKWSSYNGVATPTSTFVRATTSGGNITTIFKPVINTGAVNSFAFDGNDSLLVTGPTVINGKSVGQLADINIINGKTNTLFFSGKGFTGGNVFHTRYRNGGFFLAGNFTQYDGTSVSKVIKINQTVSQPIYDFSSACEGDTLDINGYNLGTAQSVTWGTLNLGFRVVSDESIKAFIPKGLVTGIRKQDSLVVKTLYPIYVNPPYLYVYKIPSAPVISTPVINQYQTIRLGETAKDVRFTVRTYDSRNYMLATQDLKNGYLYNDGDSLFISYGTYWAGQDTARVYLTYNSEEYDIRGCDSKYTELPVKVSIENKPGLAISGKTKIQPGVIEQYQVVRTDTVASYADSEIGYNWYYIANNSNNFTQQYLYVPAGSTPSDTAKAQFSFLSNTPEGRIVAVASLVQYVEGSTYYTPFDTLYIPLKITASAVASTTCVDTLGCNSGYNINKVTIGDFVFDQKINKIECLGNGYSDFTADTFSYVNTNGTALNIPLPKQTVYTSGRLNLKIQSDIAQYYAVWIDLNNDNDFTDPQEFRVASAKPSLICDTSIIIPNYDRSIGERKMRIRSSNQALTDPCTLKVSTIPANEKGETEDYVIILAPYLSLQANQVITPNEDGKNEFLDIRGVDPTVTERLLIIYDKFGKKVYENTNYGDAEKWTGLDQSGKLLESGTYYFYYKNGERTLKNFVEVLRDNN